MKKFRLLRPDEIECRVAKCSANGVSLLLYKTARTDADLLDETVGPANWMNDFKVLDGTLYGGIGVSYEEYSGEYVWKWDAGTESNAEKEKGRASDAFKRAGFKHGIGRELYSAPFIWIKADKCNVKQGNGGKWQCYDNFIVTDISYDETERISGLVICVKGKEVYRMGASSEAPSQKKSVPVACSKCGHTVKSAKTKDGNVLDACEAVHKSQEEFGQVLCWRCLMEARKSANHS